MDFKHFVEMNAGTTSPVVIAIIILTGNGIITLTITLTGIGTIFIFIGGTTRSRGFLFE